jgi:predicted dithiol-disulfide oxidoreductase (DUF899 family)
MSLPGVVTREEWLVAREALLAEEKAATRARDALSAERRRLPMVEITEDYRFEGPEGPVGLLDLFEGRRQLIVYHFMFDPDWEDGCSSCTAGIDEVAPGFLDHLHTRDTTFALVSRAPLAKLERWKAQRGWDLPWYSSLGSAFNHDFGVTLDESHRVYNYREEPPPDGSMEAPGRSCFLQVDGRVFHTYSQYARGLESTGGSYYFLDLTALGRQEDWEEPKGRSDAARAAVPDFSE